MKVVAHQDVGEDFGLVDVRGAFKQIEKGQAVGIGKKDNLSVIAATGYMVIGILELDPKWPGHASKCTISSGFVKDKDLTPIFDPSGCSHAQSGRISINGTSERRVGRHTGHFCLRKDKH
jgi:hypothetical protein